MARRGEGGGIRPVGIALSALVALGVAGGCADDDGGRSRPADDRRRRTRPRARARSTTSRSSSTPTSRSGTTATSRPPTRWTRPTPRSPSTRPGEQLETLERAFLARQANGEVIRGTLDLAPACVSVVGDTATVRDCYLDNTGIYDAETGERHDTATRRPAPHHRDPRRRGRDLEGERPRAGGRRMHRRLIARG